MKYTNLEDFSLLLKDHREFILFIGRVLIGFFFFYKGVTKLTASLAGFSSYVGSLGFPAPVFFARAAVGVELVGGLMLLIGYRSALAGSLLTVYLMVVNTVAHPFWVNIQQLESFITNLSTVGGLLLVSTLESSKYSVESFLYD